MNEEAKTATFWVVALVMAALAAFVTWPRPIESEESVQIGKALFEDFTDPLVTSSLRIVTFDSEQSAISEFEVAKDNEGVWRIPTHAGYIADAEEQMQKAATLFLDNRILDVSTTNREDHASFGVVNPTSGSVRVGSEGVGRLVMMKDSKGVTLVSLVVGNEVEGREGQRYVRRPAQDIVYAVELDDSALTTRFTDWIEDDLLQLNPFDIAELTINNYTASLDLLQGSVREQREFSATISTDGSEWNLERLDVYKEGTSVPRPLAEGETLNSQRLNEVKNALDDLKIADVGRKPAGMSANLKASEEFLDDEQALTSMVVRGFIPAGRAGSEEREILAANGEIAVSTKEGVRYILRFGNVAGLSEAEQQEAAARADEPGGLIGSNRYLLVTTELDESRIPVPDLQPVPQTIEELDRLDAAEDQPEDQPEAMEDKDKPAKDADADASKPQTEEMKEEPASDSKSAEEPKATEPTEDAEAAEPTEESPADAKGDEEEASGESSDVTEEPAAEEQPDGCDDGEGEGEAAGESEAESAATEQEASADTNDSATPEPAEEETEQEKQERLEAAQEQITKENQRKLDARQEQLETARKRVAELNARFADWYYEISESTFGKLQLGLNALIQKEGEQEAAAQPPAGFDPSSGLPDFQFPGGN